MSRSFAELPLVRLAGDPARDGRFAAAQDRPPAHRGALLAELGGLPLRFRPREAARPNE